MARPYSSIVSIGIGLAVVLLVSESALADPIPTVPGFGGTGIISLALLILLLFALNLPINMMFISVLSLIALRLFGRNGITQDEDSHKILTNTINTVLVVTILGVVLDFILFYGSGTLQVDGTIPLVPFWPTLSNLVIGLSIIFITVHSSSMLFMRFSLMPALVTAMGMVVVNAAMWRVFMDEASVAPVMAVICGVLSIPVILVFRRWYLSNIGEVHDASTVRGTKPTE